MLVVQLWSQGLSAAGLLASFQEQGSVKHSLVHLLTHLAQVYRQVQMTFVLLVSVLLLHLSFSSVLQFHLFKRNKQLIVPGCIIQTDCQQGYSLSGEKQNTLYVPVRLLTGI